MKCTFLIIIYLALFFNGYSQTSSTVSVSSSGWKRVGYVDLIAGRGFGKVSIYTTGGNLAPQFLDIHCLKIGLQMQVYVLKLTVRLPIGRMYVLHTIRSQCL
ncbi:hypothetical protein FAZ15_16205 [Sphingobacterium olei]|uniref:Uncharacterized protein n=1 Tax=Sphingobacterium olei TaxID=2571155 RepID=A0A4U0NH95_9SPHI|nr:hypothetical protein [Sphingobacterium olei]TJZ53581.1 hypothetical protein FAZ15_16205 [Sphingobacterium olei]